MSDPTPTLSLTSVGNQSIQVTWTNNPNLDCNRSTLLVNDTGYSQTGTGSPIMKFDVSLNNLNPSNPTAYNITGLVNGRTYLITYIQTQDSSIGHQGASNTISAVPYTIPAAPIINGIVDASGLFNVDVSFGSNGGNQLARIEFVVCSTTAMSTFVYDISGYNYQAGQGAVFEVSGGIIQNYTPYEVAAYVINLAGQSSISNTEIAYPTDAPNPARNLSIYTLGVSGTLQTNWLAPVDCLEAEVDYYIVDISGVVGGDPQEFALGGAAAAARVGTGKAFQFFPPTFCSDMSGAISGLTNGSHYQFVVYAHNEHGFSLPSNVEPSSGVAAATDNFPFAPYAAPSTNVVTFQTDIQDDPLDLCDPYLPQLTITWTPPPNPSDTGSTPYKYQVDISYGAIRDTLSIGGTTLIPYNPLDTSYSIVLTDEYAYGAKNFPYTASGTRSLAFGTTYYVFVRAINDDCFDNIDSPNISGTVAPLWGPYNAAASVTPYALPPAINANSLSVLPGNQGVEIYWQQGGNNGSQIIDFTIDISGINPHDGSYNSFHQTYIQPAYLIGTVGTQYYYDVSNVLTNGWPYQVRVYQRNIAGEGTCADQYEQFIPAGDPPMVTNLSSSGLTSTTGQITWTVPSRGAWTTSAYNSDCHSGSNVNVPFDWRTIPDIRSNPITVPNSTGYILYTYDISRNPYSTPIPVAFVDVSNAESITIEYLPENGTTLWGIATRAAVTCGGTYENSVVQPKYLSLAASPTIVRIDLSGSISAYESVVDPNTLRVIVNDNGNEINEISAFAVALVDGVATLPVTGSNPTIVKSGPGTGYGRGLPDTVKVFYFTYPYALTTPYTDSSWAQPYQVNVANAQGMTTVTNYMNVPV